MCLIATFQAGILRREFQTVVGVDEEVEGEKEAKEIEDAKERRTRLDSRSRHNENRELGPNEEEDSLSGEFAEVDVHSVDAWRETGERDGPGSGDGHLYAEIDVRR